MSSSIVRKAVRIVLTTLALANAGVLATVLHFEQISPAKPSFLVPQSDKILVVFRTKFGSYRYLNLKNWLELEVYLDKNNLQLPPINDAFLAPNLNAEIKGTSIVWSTKEKPKVIATPDYLSATRLLPYISFGNIEPSPLGYSLPLEHPSSVRSVALE